jgi:hypothetical protein
VFSMCSLQLWRLALGLGKLRPHLQPECQTLAFFPWFFQRPAAPKPTLLPTACATTSQASCSPSGAHGPKYPNSQPQSPPQAFRHSGQG